MMEKLEVKNVNFRSTKSLDLKLREVVGNYGVSVTFLIRAILKEKLDSDNLTPLEKAFIDMLDNE